MEDKTLEDLVEDHFHHLPINFTLAEEVELDTKTKDVEEVVVTAVEWCSLYLVVLRAPGKLQFPPKELLEETVIVIAQLVMDQEEEEQVDRSTFNFHQIQTSPNRLRCR